MKTEAFLKQLEYLLQDISEEEKGDAIAYYRDYLDEAGPEREEEVLRGFGSPERIAAMIRADLAGEMKEGGEFTEAGFTDQRFETVRYPAVTGNPQPNTTSETADQAATGPQTGRDGWKQAGGGTKKAGRQYQSVKERQGKQSKDDWWKYLLIGLGILVLAPTILSFIFGAAGSAIGVLAALAASFLVLAVLTILSFIGAVSLFALGIAQLIPSFWLGLMLLGFAFLAAGCGCLLLFCSWQFYGRFLPWLVKSVIRLVKELISGKQSREDAEEWRDEQ